MSSNWNLKRRWRPHAPNADYSLDQVPTPTEDTYDMRKSESEWMLRNLAFKRNPPSVMWYSVATSRFVMPSPSVRDGGTDYLGRTYSTRNPNDKLVPVPVPEAVRHMQTGSQFEDLMKIASRTLECLPQYEGELAPAGPLPDVQVRVKESRFNSDSDYVPPQPDEVLSRYKRKQYPGGELRE